MSVVKTLPGQKSGGGIEVSLRHRDDVWKEPPRSHKRLALLGEKPGANSPGARLWSQSLNVTGGDRITNKFRQKRAGREILEQELLRSLTAMLPGVQRRLPIGLSGFIWGDRWHQPAQAHRKRRKRRCSGLAGSGAAGPRRTRTAELGRAASAHRDDGGGRGLLRAPALWGLWDSGGR